jgi:hypothetical protein
MNMFACCRVVSLGTTKKVSKSDDYSFLERGRGQYACHQISFSHSRILVLMAWPASSRCMHAPSSQSRW